MLTIPKTTTIAVIIASIESARTSGKNYIDVAKALLAKHTSLTIDNIHMLLDTFQWDKYLINIIIATQSIKPQEVIKLLGTCKTPSYITYECAGEQFCDDEEFIITLIATMYKRNIRYAQKLTVRFAHVISDDGAIALLNETDNDFYLQQALLNVLMKVA